MYYRWEEIKLKEFNKGRIVQDVHKAACYKVGTQ